jgi:prepilin-type N-terminal cleavage/methylation domain-containing protein
MQFRPATQRGVTLIELTIAITLVAAIAVGMLTAMRTSLASLERTQARLEENRRAMGVQQTILRQIGGLMPVIGDCGIAPAIRMPVFGGTPDSLHLVTNYSFTEGFRGYPRIVHYQVLPEPEGTFRLVMNEYLWAGPVSSAPLCAAGRFLPLQVNPNTTVLATGLAYCRFFYHERFEALDAGNWLPLWDRPNLLPTAVRIEMAERRPSPARLPMVSLHIPIRISRDIGARYGEY